MNTRIRPAVAGLLLSGVLAPAAVAQEAADPSASPSASSAEPRVVELAICLDRSGSMQGLIDAARQKLWAIVNDLALAQPTPRLRIALLTFGHEHHPPEAGWVKVETPFTDDLDIVSQHLFGLTTGGQTEYVGRVLQTAEGLDWTAGDDVLKLLIVAGNESADQDQEVPFRAVCPRLIGRGVIVNAIYCGPEADEIAPTWREVARLADGRFAAIDQDQGTVVIETPMDRELGELSTGLNDTYLWYGPLGATMRDNQWAQDRNCVGLNLEAVASRAQTKANGLYFNGSDLVDATRNGLVALADVETEDLPESMRELSAEERQKMIDEHAARRKEIQERIRKLSEERQSWLDAEMKRRELDDSKAFDNAVRGAIRDQAKELGFTFADEAPAADAAEPAKAEDAGGE